MLLEDKSLLRKRELLEGIVLKQLNSLICQYFKKAAITYSPRSSTKCEKTSSGRTAMALKDKDLFRKNSRENINYQIESMNILRRKYHTNKLNL